MRQIAATHCIDKLPRLHFCFNQAACAHLVAGICSTNSNQLEFVTDRKDNDFYLSHKVICCSSLSWWHVAVICRIGHLMCTNQTILMITLLSILKDPRGIFMRILSKFLSTSSEILIFKDLDQDPWGYFMDLQRYFSKILQRSLKKLETKCKDLSF